MKNILKNNNVEIETLNNDEILFNIDLLNDSTFKRLIKYYDSISGSPIEYIILGSLIALSGAIGKGVKFKITNSLNIYLNVWGVIIGRSTIMRKSSSINLVVRELQRIDKNNYRGYKEQLSMYESKLSEIKNPIEKMELEKPKREYILFPQDSTIESLSDILSISDRGLVFHQEFGGFLQNLNKGYSGDAKQFFTSIYDVIEAYEVSRVVKGSTLLNRPYLSILGASTIDWVTENSNESDLRTGFFARFLYAIRNRPTKKYIPLLELREKFNQNHSSFDVKSLYERIIHLDKINLEITNEAAELFNSYDIQSYKELFNIENDNELSFKSRLLIYTLKFAGIIALTDNRTIIELNDIQDGIILSEYFKKNIELLLNKELVTTEFNRKEEKIIKIIESKGGELKRSDLMNYSNLKAKELDEYIENLIEKELLTEAFISNSKGKKRSTIYHLTNKQ